MNSNCLGDMIRNVREERKVTQSELCKGLCSVATLSRIEAGERLPDYLLTKALLDRLRLQTDSLEMVLYDEDFDRLEQRKLIDRLIFEGRSDRASTLLEDYERSVPRMFPLEKQYILHRKALILCRDLHIESRVMQPQMLDFSFREIDKGKAEEVTDLLKQALLQTTELQGKKEKLYSIEEIMLNLELHILKCFLEQYDRESCRSYILNIQNIIIRIGNEQYYNTELSYVMAGAGILLSKWYCREKEPSVALQLLMIITQTVDACGSFKALGLLCLLKAELHERMQLDEKGRGYVAEMYREALSCFDFIGDALAGKVAERLGEKNYDSI